MDGGRCSATSAAAGEREPGPLETMSRADVSEAVDYGLAAGRSVRTLLRALAQAGCPIGRSSFHVLRCDAAVGGGFAPEHGVILCHNRLHTRREVLNALAHELLHAYDHCRGGGGAAWQTEEAAGEAGAGALGDGPTELRASGAAVVEAGGAAAAAAQAGPGPGPGHEAPAAGPPGAGCGGGGGGGGLDWSDCRQHACTEIRAANLSGDCSLWQELQRGNLPLAPTAWAAQQRACVARRAALSCALNPGCGGPEGAAQAVAAALPACLADTAPFGPDQAVARP
ncbi:hypothetical protein HYH03_017947 [Edaphochlamys debaryana]|uniref:Mitochondrial inner membrane protease ATP23 n=1 Tax=Edaphochlamys debaryana TaxID=47281 RepID=A0A835XLD2_9CHLO|nr:hypothetical protein HYH03_017947 [Edaphochlamys debaryana]|eukprot:KAG2483155.1 hypothetical protein HYH03_017947 [Edaphochlamys debaryana]